MGPWLDSLARGRPLIFWGHSIGGLICPSIVAESREADAVILETTGPSFAAVAEDRKPWFAPFIRTHVTDDLKPYDTAELLKDFKGRIMVLGAGKDTTLPPRLARSLAEALTAKGLNIQYWEYPAANHHSAALNPQFVEDARPFFAVATNVNH
jgi:pimeloyl-ACP methyl ester carboxylesterase